MQELQILLVIFLVISEVLNFTNLNGKVLMDIEESYFASSGSGGTGRPADIDPQALLLLDALIER